MYHRETSRLICVENQMTDFWFTKRFFWIVDTISGINFSYQQRLYANRKIKWFVRVAAPYFTDWLLHASLHIVVIPLFSCSIFIVYVQNMKRNGVLSVDLNILHKYKTFNKVLKVLKIVQKKCSFTYCIISFSSVTR